MQFKTLLSLLFAYPFFISSSLASWNTEDIRWDNRSTWIHSMEHSVEFFNRSAWMSNCEVYLTQIDAFGNRTASEHRGIVALSRMLYGLAHSSHISKANAVAEFILQKMVRRDQIGEYFVPVVDSFGRPLNAKGEVVAPPEELVVSEQAYGLSGLVALYQVTADTKLLERIRSLYISFYKRFHDPEKLGFFDRFSVKTQTTSATKSYNSTVYVATSFLFELAKTDLNFASHEVPGYQSTVHELGGLIVSHFLDPSTGWLNENFDRDWQVAWRDWQKQPEGTIGVVGHNFQAAWLLLRMSSVSEGIRATKYRDAAKFILTQMLSKPVIDSSNGGLFDVFVRETSKHMWHTNKAWWQQAEGILAMTLAERMNLFDGHKELSAKLTAERDKAMAFYFRHFVDTKFGGEFAEVQADGAPLMDKLKGDFGKSTYHTVELARYMLRYSNGDIAENSTHPALAEAPLNRPQSRYDNPVKTALKNGQLVYGGFLMAPSAENAERLASKTHFVWIDAEHGVFTPESVINIISRFHMTTPAIPVIRVPSWDFTGLKPFLDTGVLGVVVPEVKSADQVQAFIKRVKYPPLGDRGFGPARSTGYLDPELSREAIEKANDQVLVVVMIETPEAVANIEEIASTPGIDVLHIGPYDLALKMGRLAMDDPRVLDAIAKIETAARAHDIPLGAPVGSRAAAHEKLKKGYQFLTIPSDQEMIVSGLDRFMNSK